MNPKLPSHVIQSRKYLLKVHCVLDTGNTKINKMQWKFQFAGETSRQFCFMSSDLQYRDVHIVETKWRNIEGSGDSSAWRNQKNLPRRGHPVQDQVWSGICQIDLVMDWLPGKRSGAGRECGPLGEGVSSSLRVELGRRWVAQCGEARQGGRGSLCQARSSLPKGLILSHSLGDWSHWRI